MIDRTFDVRLEVIAPNGSVTEQAILVRAPTNLEAMARGVQDALNVLSATSHQFRVRALWAVIHPSDKQQRPTRAMHDD